jgi:hypothetical protein
MGGAAFPQNAGYNPTVTIHCELQAPAETKALAGNQQTH